MEFEERGYYFKNYLSDILTGASKCKQQAKLLLPI
jgi:hypothetical protein